jgi:hypothetical protein
MKVIKTLWAYPRNTLYFNDNAIIEVKKYILNIFSLKKNKFTTLKIEKKGSIEIVDFENICL